MKKKKIIASLLALSAILSIAGCKKDDETGTSVSPSTMTTETSTATTESTTTAPTPTTESTTTESTTTESTPDNQTVTTQDFTDITTIGDKPSELGNGTLYLDSTAKGSVVIEGDTKYAKVTGGNADTTLYMNLEGLDNGTVKIEFDFALTGVQGSWTFFQMYGSSEKYSEAEIFSFRTGKDDSTKETYIGYRPDKDGALVEFDSRVIYTGTPADWYHSELFFDTATGSGTAKISKGGVEYSATFTDMLYEIKSLKFMAKKDSKAVSIDNISVTHVQGEFSQVKAKRLADLERLYATYEQTAYTTNYAAITAKYNEVKAALTAATSFDALSDAYGPGITAIKEFKSDAQIAKEELDAAIAAAKAEVKAKYDALVAEKYYTSEEKTALDEMYATCISVIAGSIDISTIEALVTESKATLDSLPATGTGPIEVTKYEFNANDLTVGNCTEEFTVANFFNVKPLASKTAVDANDKTMDDLVFNKRIKMGGATKATDGGYISFTLTSTASVSVYAMSSSNSVKDPTKPPRNIMIFNSLDNMTPVQQELSDGVALVKLTCTLEAGTYYVGSTDGAINIYGIFVTIN